MTTPSKALRRLSWIGAVMAAVWGGFVLSGAISSAWYLYGMFAEQESGGLGAVSAGISELIVTVVLGGPLFSIVVNLLLRRWARATPGRARLLHRLHSLALVVLFAGAAFGVALALRPGASPDVVFLMTWALALASVNGVQFLILSALLTLFARS